MHRQGRLCIPISPINICKLPRKVSAYLELRTWESSRLEHGLLEEMVFRRIGVVAVSHTLHILVFGEESICYTGDQHLRARVSGGLISSVVEERTPAISMAVIAPRDMMGGLVAFEGIRGCLVEKTKL